MTEASIDVAQQGDKTQRQEWRTKYHTYAAQFLHHLAPRETFTGEDLRLYIAERAGSPYHPNCWGSMFARTMDDWRTDGSVELVGIGRMQRRHDGRMTPLYRKTGSILARMLHSLTKS